MNYVKPSFKERIIFGIYAGIRPKAMRNTLAAVGTVVGLYLTYRGFKSLDKMTDVVIYRQSSEEIKLAESLGEGDYMTVVSCGICGKPHLTTNAWLGFEGPNHPACDAGNFVE